MNRTLKVILWLLFAIAIVAGGIFFRYSYRNALGKQIEVSFVNQKSHFFDNDAIKSMIIKVTDSIHLKKIKEIDLKKIEKDLIQSPFIQNADVYFSLQRNLMVKIKEYEPVIKVMDSRQKKYYLNKDGTFIPPKKGISINVPIVYGNITSPNKLDSLMRYNTNISSLENSQVLKDIFLVYLSVKKNKFVDSQINHIYINKKQEFELIPTIGRHVFLLGDVSHLKDKITKIGIFYHQILKNNGWNKYKVINLKYNHQIVCEKSS